MSSAVTPLEEVRGAIQKMAPQFKNALPAQIPVERFVRVVQTAIAANTDLLGVDRTSLYAAAMRCAQDGLLPDGREAAIVPFGSNARYMPMVGGIAKKIRNSGELKTLNAEVVYTNDAYDHWSDEKGEHFEHRKCRGDRGEPVLTYAYALTKDDGFFFEEIFEEDMAQIEKLAKAKDTPWRGPFRDEMRKKSAVKRLAKWKLPSNSDVDELLHVDDDMVSVQAEPVNVTPAPAPSLPAPARRPRSLARVVEKSQPPAAQQAASAVEPEKSKTNVPTDVI